MNSITKALNILGLFTDNNDGLTLGYIAKSLGLKESTTSHIVSTLAVNGFLNQPMKRGKYYLGVRFLDIAGAIRTDYDDKFIISYLVELSQLLNESVCLEIWHGNKFPFSGTVYYSTGQDYNEWAIRRLHSTCVGKIILANLRSEDLKKYFRYRKLKKLPPSIRVDVEQFKAELAAIKREGVAYEDEEGGVGIRGIAAGIRNSEGEIIGCVFIVGSTNHLTSTKLKEMAPSVKACASKITNLFMNKDTDSENGIYVKNTIPSYNKLAWFIKKTVSLKVMNRRIETVNSITKALNILGLFTDNNDGLTLGYIAKSLGLKEPTTSHIVSTLAVNGFLNQPMKRGKYYLGVRFFDIAGAIRTDYGNKLTISYLVELSQLLNESVCLEIWHGNKFPFSGTVYYSTGQDYNEWAIRRLHSTCVGKIILANLRSEDLKKYFRYRKLKKLPPSIRVDVEQFKAELAAIKREGVAYEDEEGGVGIRGIAAGIRNSEGEIIGCVFIVGNANHLTSTKLKEMAPSVKACASKITNALVASTSSNLTAS